MRLSVLSGLSQAGIQVDRDENVLAKILVDFERAWQSGQRPALFDFLSRVSDELRSSLLQQLVPLDAKHRQQLGEVVSVDDYRDLCESVGLDPAVCLSNLISPTPANRAARQLDVTGDYLAPELADSGSVAFIVEQGATRNAPKPDDVKPAVAYIGRYRIERVLGKGGFGLVYLAHDEQLDRRVAIKVPHAHLIGDPENIASYIAEARTVAKLDHPHIVPVYDVGSTNEVRCFIVSKFIEGSDLAAVLKQKRLGYRQAAQWIAAIAEALHYAHKAGLVHRDVKPGNILIGKDQQPYVVDFGLALREENIGQGPHFAGTPAYISPEQARGEGHRVDGRSDIFSLGAVFYELLVGRRAFRGDTFQEVSERIIRYEPRPLRQYDENIPKELERICHKALAKRATDRYSTGFDLAQDLWLFLQEQAQLHVGHSPATPAGLPIGDNDRLSADSGRAQSPTPTPTTPAFADSQPVKIVPKGLRSFDAHDADFFLELLPGPRDREGLPDSLRFWKTRIEESDPDNTFSVGLVYGPSGCGKSSLVKAGLLPRLSADVIAVYVEATPDETETRLLHGLRKRCPGLEDNLSLKATLAALRRGQGIPVGKKVLIVLDQFEQWLHAKKEEENSELVQALRQCDGGRVQCIVMVRDDFWLAATRFGMQLEVDFVPGSNMALADLFDLDHARKVLAAFGRAFGKLPDSLREVDNEKKSFLKESVAGLAEDGKVICVRLALFAEMMKGKAWTPATLKEVGGTKGIGVTFLEETFSVQTAVPRHRLHQKAARAVLKALLPDSGTDIKGTMRSYAELLEASGYGNRPKDFDDLIRILDSEIRLITPTDPEGIEKGEERSEKSERQRVTDRSSITSHFTLRSSHFYQLTHDYLVHSLRDWLTRKQRETKNGRAELKLAERAATWAAKPENKQLPTLWEWLTIRRLTEQAKWNPNEQRLMSRATRDHTLRAGWVTMLGVLLMVGGIGLKRWNDARQLERDAINLVSSIQTADYDKLPDLIAMPEAMRTVVVPKLKTALEQHALQSAERLKLSLGLLPSDPGQVDYLLQRLLSADANQVPLLVSQLQPRAMLIEPQLWTTAKQHDPQSLLQAASALANYAPKDEQWVSIAGQVADQVVQENPLRIAVWIEALRPVAKPLNPELQRIYAASAESRPQTEIDLATEILESYAADDFKLLHELVLVGQPRQFSKMFPNYSRFRQQALEVLRNELAQPFTPENPDLPTEDLQRLRLAHIAKQANAAVALVRLEDPTPVYQFLTVDRDPEALSQFIYRIRGREVSSSLLIKSFQELQAQPVPADPQQRQHHFFRLYGFLLGLGEYTLEQLPAQQREAFVADLAQMYGSHPSRAVHSALGWLLRRWGQDEVVRRVDETPLDYDESGQREWYVLKIDPPRRAADPGPKNGLNDDAAADEATVGVKTTNAKPLIDLAAPIYFTMIVFAGGKFEMGDPKNRQRGKVSGPLAVSDREVTWRQFSPIDGDTHRQSWERQFKRLLGDEDPTFGLSWFDCVNYCRWLSSALGLDEARQSYEELEFPEGAESQGPGWLNLPVTTEWPLRTGRPGFRLLTEAEWEYVARSGTETTYSFGDSESLLGDYCWYQANSGDWSHRTGLLRPSVGGLYDIHGSLFEWTNDWNTRGSNRVSRGGSWGSGAAACRSANRYYVTPTDRTSSVGFRLALSPPSRAQVPAEPDRDR
ncbi:MAG: protein kinase [Pirellulaceae bacterium]|nr:protein kinase [Pirellulaceae bacterium]